MPVFELHRLRLLPRCPQLTRGVDADRSPSRNLRPCQPEKSVNRSSLYEFFPTSWSGSANESVPPSRNEAPLERMHLSFQEAGIRLELPLQQPSGEVCQGCLGHESGQG